MFQIINSNKRKVTLLIVASVALYFFVVGFCSSSYNCSVGDHWLLESLFLIVPVAPISVALSFFWDRHFWTWFTFSTIWLPCAIFISYSAGNGGVSVISMDALQVAYLLSLVYIVISLLLMFTLWSLSKIMDRKIKG